MNFAYCGDKGAIMEVLSSEALEYQTTNKQRLYDDTTTWLAEALDGTMRTSFELSFDGEDLYSQDGGSMSEVFNNSLLIAENLPVNSGFEWRRRRHELAEYQEMLEMMHGSNFNTMVVVSDFPKELEGQNGDIGGYNCSRKQTMLRVISKNSKDKLILTTQTLDGSNRQALQAIYAYFGLEPKEGELLGQRIHLQLNQIDQAKLTDDLTKVYDNRLQEQYGGEWLGGRQESNLHDTYYFVKQQTDLVNYYLESTEKFGENRSILLGVVSAIETRFKNSERFFTNSSHRVTQDLILAEVANAYTAALLNNRQFSGCGLSLNNAKEINTILNISGYGNKLETEHKYSFNKKMYCVVCQVPPKNKNEPKKMCGPCGICRSCDNKLSSKIK